MTRRWRWLVGAGCAFTGIWSVVAQGQVRDTTPMLRTSRAVCAGQVISRIDIQTYPPFDSGGTTFAARVAHFASSLHSTTRPSVVRRYLAMQVGDRCDEFRLRESERILRAQPFLADATVVAGPDGSGGVVIRVVTVDETSLIIDGSASAKTPIIHAFRLGDQNIGGGGVSASAGWQYTPYRRDIFRGKFVDYQFLGRPYQLSVDATRNEIGGSWDAEASHPFFTDLQRFSWRATMGAETTYRYFERIDAPDVGLLFTRAYGDVGGVVAVGPLAQGHHFLIGGTISRERERTGRMPVIVNDSAIIQDTSTALIGRYGEHRSTRVNLLLGFRDVSFVTVRGFDAVEGAQDMRTGVQVSTLFGRGLNIDGDDRDYFMSADVYGGHATPASFTGIEVETERRRALDTHQWDGILATGRYAWYLHPAPKHTTLVDVEYSGGWRQRVPFQLTFSDREGGMPGFGASELGGGQRLVTRWEERYQLGHVRQFAALAGAIFVDAGKLWAGDAPFGITTGVKTSVGIGLLAALPPRSRRTWRIDIAHAINDRTSRGIEVRFSNHDFTRWFWREPGDVQTSRERSIPNSVYNWP